MVYVENVTTEELGLLQKHYHLAQCALIRERAHAILLSNQRRPARDIAAILMRSENTIRQWLNTFQERRLSSIFHEYQNNINASKLTKEQREEIKHILGLPPSQQGLPKAFWDVPTLKQYLRAEFGVVYESERSYHYLLRFNGLSFKSPTVFDKRRNVDQINNKLQEISDELSSYLASSEWEVLVADETRITWEAEVRRAWIQKNAKTIMKVHRDDQYQNFFGALNLKNGRAHVVRLEWQNQQTMIASLKQLANIYPDKRICVVWDNARWHKGKELREELRYGKLLQRVHLMNFPPYAPDVNPQEHVWKYAKDHIANDNVPDSFQKTIELFELAVHSGTFNCQIPEFVLR